MVSQEKACFLVTAHFVLLEWVLGLHLVLENTSLLAQQRVGEQGDPSLGPPHSSLIQKEETVRQRAWE